jgi:pimeloyl-ACP methyl ester carboxylesterase
MVRASLIAPKLADSRIALWGARSAFRKELLRKGAMTKAELQRFEEVWGSRSRRPSANPYRAQHRARKEPIDERCRPIACPVLVIYGEEDPYTGRHFAEPPVDWVPNARLELLSGANHRVQLHAPDRVTGLLLDFLTTEKEAAAEV